MVFELLIECYDYCDETHQCWWYKNENIYGLKIAQNLLNLAGPILTHNLGFIYVFYIKTKTMLISSDQRWVAHISQISQPLPLSGSLKLCSLMKKK